MATATPRFSAAAFSALPMAQATSESKLLELQALFLQRDFFEIMIDAHEISS